MTSTKSDNTSTPGNTALLVIGWLLLSAFVVIAMVLGNYRSNVRWFQMAWAIGFVGYGLLVFAVWRSPGRTQDRAWWGWLAGFVLLRITLLGTVPSDDLHRYVWEGHIQRAGFNPYTHAPLDPRLASLAEDDPNWALINHPDYAAIYPPVAQMVFRWISAVSLSVNVMKGCWVAVDIAAIVLLGRLLAVMNLPRSRAVIYAASPLTLAAFAIDGHLDSLMIALLFVTALAAEKKLWYWCGIVLGLAIASKLMCAVAWPWLALRHRRAALLTPVVVALCYVPYIDAGRQLFASLTRFGTRGSSMLEWLLGSSEPGFETGIRIAAVVVLVVMLAVQLRHRPTFAELATRSLSTLALLLPVKHFWYLTWFLAFAWARPRVSWLLLTAAMGLYFQAELQRRLTGSWAMPSWVYQVIAAVFVVAWCVETLLRSRRSVRVSD